MRQNDFCVITLAILCVLTWNTNVGEVKLPRDWKSSAEVNHRLETTLRGLVGAKRMGQNLKRHVLKEAVALPEMHHVTIIALALGSDVAEQVNGTLLVLGTSPRY